MKRDFQAFVQPRAENTPEIRREIRRPAGKYSVPEAAA